MHESRLLNILLPLFAIMVCQTQAAIGDSDTEREMRAGLQLAKERFHDCTVHASVQVVNWRDYSRPSVHDVILRNGQFYLNSTVDVKSKIQTIQCANDRYVFAVSKKHDSSDYSLVKLHALNETNAGTQASILSNMDVIAASLFGTYNLRGWQLWDLVNDPGYKIRSMENLERNGNSYVRTRFLIDPQSPPKTSVDRPIVGYFDCQPSENWAMAEFYVKDRDEDSNSVLTTVEFGELVEGLRMSSKVWTSSPRVAPSVFTATVVEHGDRVLQYKIRSLNHALVSDEVFFLSHYGLPEPNFRFRWFGPWVAYLALGSFFAVAGYYLLRRRSIR